MDGTCLNKIKISDSPNRIRWNDKGNATYLAIALQDSEVIQIFFKLNIPRVDSISLLRFIHAQIIIFEPLSGQSIQTYQSSDCSFHDIHWLSEDAFLSISHNRWHLSNPQPEKNFQFNQVRCLINFMP